MHRKWTVKRSRFLDHAKITTTIGLSQVRRALPNDVWGRMLVLLRFRNKTQSPLIYIFITTRHFE